MTEVICSICLMPAKDYIKHYSSDNVTCLACDDYAESIYAEQGGQ